MYEIVTMKEVSEYLNTKRDHEEKQFNKVNWEAIKMASKNIPFSKIRRNSKNASNWVALGAKMKIWKLWSHDWCPKCNKQEDNWTHIICCNGQEGRVRWEQSIRKLEAQLSEIKTAPWIIKFVPEMLSEWRKSTNLSNLPPGRIAHPAFASQSQKTQCKQIHQAGMRSQHETTIKTVCSSGNLLSLSPFWLFWGLGGVEWWGLPHETTDLQ